MNDQPRAKERADPVVAKAAAENQKVRARELRKQIRATTDHEEKLKLRQELELLYN